MYEPAPQNLCAQCRRDLAGRDITAEHCLKDQFDVLYCDAGCYSVAWGCEPNEDARHRLKLFPIAALDCFDDTHPFAEETTPDNAGAEDAEDAEEEDAEDDTPADQGNARICVDCAMWHANGDLTALDNNDGSAAAEAEAVRRYAEVTGAASARGVAHVIVGGDAGFSWTSCDLCRVNLGGDRFHAWLEDAEESTPGAEEAPRELPTFYCRSEADRRAGIDQLAGFTLTREEFRGLLEDLRDAVGGAETLAYGSPGWDQCWTVGVLEDSFERSTYWGLLIGEERDGTRTIVKSTWGTMRTYGEVTDSPEVLAKAIRLFSDADEVEG